MFGGSATEKLYFIWKEAKTSKQTVIAIGGWMQLKIICFSLKNEQISMLLQYLLLQHNFAVTLVSHLLAEVKIRTFGCQSNDVTQ